MSSEVSKYIFPPLANIVDEYTNVNYHLLMFSNRFEYMAR